MSSPAIFDSLTHPMPDGNWLHAHYRGRNTVESLLVQMREARVVKAFAVGLGERIGEYHEDTYADWVRAASPDLLPVAFVDIPVALQMGADAYIQRLHARGYVGIKIHPRIAEITLAHPFLPELIRAAHAHRLIVFVCTYFWNSRHDAYDSDVHAMQRLLSATIGCKLILLHGGVVRLLECAEIVRHFPQVILDLSFTLCKYPGSSLDADIRYLFAHYDRRICVGSDSPEFSLNDLRNRFDQLSDGLDLARCTRIASGNLQSYLEQW